MKEIISFLRENPHYKVGRRGTGLMAGAVLLVRRDGRNRFDIDRLWFVRPAWVTAPVMGRLP
jgi:hypothetical protein